MTMRSDCETLYWLLSIVPEFLGQHEDLLDRDWFYVTRLDYHDVKLRISLC